MFFTFNKNKYSRLLSQVFFILYILDMTDIFLGNYFLKIHRRALAVTQVLVTAFLKLQEKKVAISRDHGFNRSAPCVYAYHERWSGRKNNGKRRSIRDLCRRDCSLRTCARVLRLAARFRIIPEVRCAPTAATGCFELVPPSRVGG